MKRLLNTLYVLTEDSYLSFENENVVVLRDDDVLGRFPLLNIESICYFGYKGASPRLLSECVNRGIDFCFFGRNGAFYARVSGESKGNILLRKAQYRAAENPEIACAIARNFIVGKVFNSRQVIERARRDHALQVDADKLHASTERLDGLLNQIRTAANLDELRGFEEIAAQVYFSVFDSLILREKDDFRFEGRNKRPPLDRTNALLSFAYSLLTNQCAAALEGVGLDSYAGIMHQDRPGRKSLALDLMEELRGVFADRVVLDCINNRMVSKNCFEMHEGGAVYLNEDGRRAFLNIWQRKKQEALLHPYLKEKVPWGLVPHTQALLLSRYLRGDIDGYPPFLWR